MPWKETCAMDQLVMFIGDCVRREEPFAVLCERYGISRKTGYKWWARYREDPEHVFVERSRVPKRRANSMDAQIAEAIIAMRRRYPYFGPLKLLTKLEQLHPREQWPAPSSIGDLLRREGLSDRRRRQRRPTPVTQPFLQVIAPNDVWCADFKGWFRTADGTRCDPLTITDAYSRFLIACRIVEPTTEGVLPWFDRAFRELGLPHAIRTDNGAPFAGNGAAGLTRLSVHWVKLGIKLERIDPGSPQQNGRHERMHGTLKAQTSRPPAATAREQQGRFDRFREHYNHERPHAALGQQTPASCYSASLRPYPDRIEEPWYDADQAVRRVRPKGDIKWGGEHIFVSEALAGEPIGIAETDDGDWLARYAHLNLGIIDRASKKLRRFASPRPGQRKAAPEQTEKSVTYVSG